MCPWLCFCTNGIDEILALEPQWLNPIHMGYGDFPISVWNHRISVHVSPFIINFQHFRWIGIIINCHPCIAYNCHTTNLAGMEPAYVNVSSHAILKTEIEMRHIMDMWL